MIAKLIGWLLTRGDMPERLLAYAKRTPDVPIYDADDGQSLYMERFWLFNPIKNYRRRWQFIPFSIRIHVIHRPDNDRHPHDHPFNGRTWILRNGYVEHRVERWRDAMARGMLPLTYVEGDPLTEVPYTRRPGSTTTISFRKYHRITKLINGPAVTFFAFGDYKGKWGYLVDGCKVPHDQYRAVFKGK